MKTEQKFLAFAKDKIYLLVLDRTSQWRKLEFEIRVPGLDAPVLALVPRFHVERRAFLLVYASEGNSCVVLGRLPAIDGKTREPAGVAISAKWNLTRTIKTQWKQKSGTLRNLVFLSDQRHFVTFHERGVFQWCLETENECFPILPESFFTQKKLAYGTWHNELFMNCLIFSLEGEGNAKLYFLDISSALMFGADDLLFYPDDNPEKTLTIDQVCSNADLDPCVGTPFWWDFVQIETQWWMVLLSKKAKEPNKGQKTEGDMVTVSFFSVGWLQEQDGYRRPNFTHKASVILPMVIKTFPDMPSNVCTLFIDVQKKIHCLIATEQRPTQELVGTSELLFHISTVTFDTKDNEHPVHVSRAKITENDGCDNPDKPANEPQVAQLLPYANVLKYEGTRRPGLDSLKGRWSGLLVLVEEKSEYKLFHIHTRKEDHK